ncbi:hypothetical protein Taro_011313 [Colocasia esculenta]|uniref:CCHC-type domain-containing protein n=1 Tax=Colocasia esculenta TaxID=4460 RepID=A0A843UAJ9_COLES|nr:hypothetical protein [Colocasia esculenta]
MITDPYCFFLETVAAQISLLLLHDGDALLLDQGVLRVADQMKIFWDSSVLEGRPSGFQGVVPFVGRKTWWVPGCCSLRVKEDLVGSKSTIEEGDLLVTNEKDKWTEDDRKKISLNCKAKSIICCALSKKEFNRVSACKSAMEMWEKLRITYEGTDKVKETRIDILVTQYERFQMQSVETITQMFNRFTDITNGLAGLGKSYEMGDMVRKILRSLPSSWTPKVTAIEEANDLKRMSLEKLIGSLMAHELNMERVGESSSRKKHTNALKAAEGSSEEQSEDEARSEDSEDEEAMLSRRHQRILAKKKRYQSGRRYFKKNKEFKKIEGKDSKKGEPICYECKKPGYMQAECPKVKKPEFKKKNSSKKFRRYKKKAMAAAWSNSSDSDNESSSSSEEEEEANLAFMANTEE